jgi:hypothetical protein
MRHRFCGRFHMLAGMLALMAPLSCSGAADWEQAHIADALALPRPA